MTTLAEHIATAREVAERLRKSARALRDMAPYASHPRERARQHDEADRDYFRAAAIEALIEKVESIEHDD